MKMTYWTALLALVALMPFTTPNAIAQAANPPLKDTILILDASGSMWGQIDGVNKIVIAKDVVETLVRGLPDEQGLGFVAYGHRRKGDCGDIETLADVSRDRGKVITQLRSLSPRGKTPLSKSVEHAAIELNYQRQAATVVLVSDGLETCEADPCALARLLEENGLDFTVHVIGFDVTEEERSGLVCIAKETGGTFVAADNADELAEALASVATPGPVAAEGTPVPSTLALKATILSGGPLIQSKLDWRVTHADTGEAAFSAQGTGAETTEIAPGDYVVKADWSGWGDGSQIKSGTASFSVAAQQPKVVTVPIDLGLPVSLEAPDAVAEGTSVAVAWSGPDDLGAYIHVTGTEDGPRDTIYFAATAKARAQYAKGKSTTDTDSNGNGAFDIGDLAHTEIGAPSVAGEYEVRYVLDNPRIILARRPLKVTDSAYSISAPASVPAASPISISWDGPLTDGDFATLVETGSQKVFDNRSTARFVEGEPATLTAPAEPGKYEIRYILANGYTTYPGMHHAVQASTAIEVTAVSAKLSAPSSATGGSTITISWQGPTEGMDNDVISVVTVGATKSNRDSQVALNRREDEAENRIRLRVPAIAGSYELVYVLHPGAEIIARAPITIDQAQASVDAPDQVKAGSSFTVAYSGDAFAGDRVVVVPADMPDNAMWNRTPRYGFVAQADGTSGTVTSYPIQGGPGVYEARYVTGLQHQVLARDQFTVVE